MERYSRRRTLAIAALSAVIGVAVLAGTWLFYHERLLAPGNDLLVWVQPAFLVAGGLLAIVGAVLLAARRPSGPELLKRAVGMIPVILVTRLIAVALRAAGFLVGAIAANPGQFSTGAIGERIANNPRSLLVNLALIAVVVVIAALGKAGPGRKDATKMGER